jgi:hypothetical protein
MVWQIYADESVDQNGWFVLAGYAAHKNDWIEFSREWNALLPKFGVLNLKDGGYSFHMVEMASTEERMNRVAVFGKTIERHIEFMMAIRLFLPDLNRAQRRLFIPGRKLLRFPPSEECYRLAWNQMMATFAAYRQTVADIIPPMEEIEFIFDEHSGARKFLLEWDKEERTYPTLSSSYTAWPRFEDDRNHPGLQAADMLAWRIRRVCPVNGQAQKLPPLEELWPNHKPMKFLDMVLQEDGITEMLMEGTADAIPSTAIIFDCKTGNYMRGKAAEVARL